MKKKWIAAIIIYLALVIACIVVIYAVPSLRGMLEKTYVTEYGKIDITDEVSAYIVRDETVYVAAQNSEIKRVAKSDKLVKAGTRVVELTPIVDEDAAAAGEAGPDATQEEAEAAAAANEEAPDNISRKYVKVMEDLGDNVRSTDEGYTRQAGYISYYVDGVEPVFATDRLADISKSDYESLTQLKALETPDKECGKGDPIFKVTSNKKWYLVFYIDNKAGEKYYEGRTVSVDIAGKSVPVTVAQVQVGKATTKVTLSCKMFFEGFLRERRLDTTITVASAEGLMLQDSSIVMKGDQPGVFVKNKLGEHAGNLKRAAVDLAQYWRTDKAMRNLEALMIVADAEDLLVISGNGEVIAPDKDVVAIGSGGNYAYSAAVALYDNTDLDAETIVRKSLEIASSICVFTNDNITVEKLGEAE